MPKVRVFRKGLWVIRVSYGEDLPTVVWRGKKPWSADRVWVCHGSLMREVTEMCPAWYRPIEGLLWGQLLIILILVMGVMCIQHSTSNPAEQELHSYRLLWLPIVTMVNYWQHQYWAHNHQDYTLYKWKKVIEYVCIVYLGKSWHQDVLWNKNRLV